MRGEAATDPRQGGPPYDPFPYSSQSRTGKAVVLAFVVVPFLATAWAAWSLWGRGVGPLELGLLFGLWTFTGLGVSVGFHRMLAHRAFHAKPVTRGVLLVAGTMALEGAPADWAATHIRHHAKADREGDPHSPLEGFWHAHVGWLVRSRFVRSGHAHERLMADPVVAWVTRTWVAWGVVSLALPAAIGWLVHGTLAGAIDCLVWGGLVRIFLLHHTTWAVNSLGHMFGSRPFRTTDLSTNNFLVALLGWGEGWHNNHHAFPRSAYMGLRWWQVDPGGWVVRLLRLLGQVEHVWRPSPADLGLRAQRT
jgi:stearoyl-CoA desaturase (Delta-9 desaturase)